MPGAARRRPAEQLCHEASPALVHASTGVHVISSISGPIGPRITRLSLMLSHPFLVKYTTTYACVWCSLSMLRSIHPAQNILSFLNLYSLLLADLLSYLSKWVRLIKFEAEYEHFYTCKVEKPQNNTSSPSFHNLHVTKKATIED